jgi:hypothetical protein
MSRVIGKNLVFFFLMASLLCTCCFADNPPDFNSNPDSNTQQAQPTESNPTDQYESQHQDTKPDNPETRPNEETDKHKSDWNVMYYR